MKKGNTFILLTESATDKFIDKLIYNNLPENAKPFFDMPVNEIMDKHPEALDNVALNGNEEVLKRYGHMKLKDFVRVSISQMFDINRNKGPKRYMRGIFRIMLDEIKCLRNPDINRINQLKDDVMYIMQASDNGSDKEAMQMDGNLNGLSLSQLNSTFKEKRKAFFAGIRDRLSSSFGKKVDAPRYKKVPIMSHEDAMRFAPYVGWCITSDNPSNYDTYTQGGRRFYVFLREGFENVERSAGENCPFDDYGMSMVSVLVDMEGNISIITTRWNHDHDGELNPPSSDQVKMVMDMMGVNLYREFPPYSSEELKAIGIVPFYEVQGMLDRGMKPKEIFNQVYSFSEGFARVVLNGKCNFIDTEDKLLSEQWYDDAFTFHEGFAVVELDGKWNFIDTEGKLLSDRWYDDTYFFSEGFARVQINGKWYYINKNGWLCDFSTKEPIRDVSAKGRSTMREWKSKGSKTFILTEEQAKALKNMKSDSKRHVIKLSEKQMSYILSESFHPKSSMVLMVKDYLDNNFKRSYIDDMNSNGYPERKSVVVWVNSNGDPLKTLSTDDLLSMLDDKFNSLIKDDDDRRRFLKQIIKDWFSKKITHDGLLSVNVV